MADDYPSARRSYRAVNPKAEGITLENFRTILKNVECPHPTCGRVGFWEERPQPNGPGIGLQCVCGFVPVEWKTWYLSKSDKPRREKFAKPPREVWAENGDMCWFCQTRYDDLWIIGATAERQHAWGYSETGHDGPILPICSKCHPHASALKHSHGRIIALWKAREKKGAA